MSLMVVNGAEDENKNIMDQEGGEKEGCSEDKVLEQDAKEPQECQRDLAREREGRDEHRDAQRRGEQWKRGEQGQRPHRRLLCVIMDGVGVRAEPWGNAVYHAWTPHMNFLKTHGFYRTLGAHGPHVGLGGEQDVGNSEVGHNALGSGQICDQGAKMVQEAIASGTIFAGAVWRQLMAHMRAQSSHHPATLHFLGILSDGNVHSHRDHLYALMERAASEGVVRMRLHVLWDGRDVPEGSAETYLQHLQQHIEAVVGRWGCDIRVASGGGRMHLTLDRYEADWQMVERGWQHHVLGQGQAFSSVEQALAWQRDQGHVSDQHLPGFVITDQGGPCGAIQDGDGVLAFHFRADRMIEISQAFVCKHFPYFDRQRHPQVFYVSLVPYDADAGIPRHFLLAGPQISHPLSATLVEQGRRQFACSETHKFGHVTFYWNGNRWGCFDQDLEEVLEIPSLPGSIEAQPWMQAHAITTATLTRIRDGSFDFARINYANGDMVGHTGNLQAAITAVAVVDQMLGQLIAACRQYNVVLVVTADHGNCEEMFWHHPGHNPAEITLELAVEDLKRLYGVRVKTSHTLSAVPLYIYDPAASHDGRRVWRQDLSEAGLAHVAGTILDLMHLPPCPHYLPSLLQKI